VPDAVIPDEPPDENEAYESLDEYLDAQDIAGQGEGPEGGRDIDADVVADQTALHEIGADLDDPDRISLLDGGMDDPDGSGPPPPDDAGRPGYLDEDLDGNEDPELQEVDVDPAELENVADDSPGPDSARW
jgi:hypothetical protein